MYPQKSSGNNKAKIKHPADGSHAIDMKHRFEMNVKRAKLDDHIRAQTHAQHTFTVTH